MSEVAKAHLAYGYDLGGDNDGWKVTGADRDGTYDFEWSDGGETFPEDATNALIIATGFTETRDDSDDWYLRRREVEMGLPIEVVRSGHYDYPGWLLIAVGSCRSVEWTETMIISPAIEAPPGWAADLAVALASLDITPKQVHAQWLMFASYG